MIGMFLEHTLTLFWLSGLLFAVALTAMHLRAPAWEAAAVVLFKVDILVETIVLLVVVVYVVCFVRSLSLCLSLSVGSSPKMRSFFFFCWRAFFAPLRVQNGSWDGTKGKRGEGVAGTRCRKRRSTRRAYDLAAKNP